MENLAEALQIALAFAVFAIGLTMLFYIVPLAKETATILITDADRTKFYQYFAVRADGTVIDATTGDEIEVDNDGMKIDSKGNREVKMKEIIPAIYRYTEENYGITIINKNGDIVARFDLDTERACNNWLNATELQKDNFVVETTNTYDQIRYIMETPNNALIDKIVSQVNDKTAIYNLFKRLYTQRIDSDDGETVTDTATIRRSPYCYWIGTLGWTAQRIDSDLSRNTCKV